MTKRYLSLLLALCLVLPLFGCTGYTGFDRAPESVMEEPQALEEGRPVIALHQKGSRFTKAGHFLVMAGKNPDGTYIVNDPNMENYYNPRLVDGFTNGFSREDVTAGLVGIYVFDRKDTFTDLRETSLTA